MTAIETINAAAEIWPVWLVMVAALYGAAWHALFFFGSAGQDTTFSPWNGDKDFCHFRKLGVHPPTKQKK